MPQATVNPAVMAGGSQYVHTKHLVNSRIYTISPLGEASTGLVNGGADAGPDTFGTTSMGVAEGITQAASLGYSEVRLMGGQWNGFTSYAVITAVPATTNFEVAADADAVFTLPLNPTAVNANWFVYPQGLSINPPTGTPIKQTPLFVFSGNTLLNWHGGQYQQATGSRTLQYGDCFLIGDNNTNLEIHHTTISNFGAWPFLMTGYWMDANNVAHSGAYSYIKEHDNTMTLNGFNGVMSSDGGGVRVGNGTYPVQTCSYIWIGDGDNILSNTFGIDVLNSSAGPVSHLRICCGQAAFINMQAPVLPPPTRIGINIEAVNFLCTDLIIGNPTVYGGNQSLQVQGNWNGVTVLAGMYEYAWTTGMGFGAGGRMLQNVLIVAPSSRNHNQQNNKTASTTFGVSALQIGVVSGTTGWVIGVTVQGGQYYDDQLTPTQRFGIAVVNQNANGNVGHISILGGRVWRNTGLTSGPFTTQVFYGRGSGNWVGPVTIKNVSGYSPFGQFPDSWVKGGAGPIAPLSPALVGTPPVIDVTGTVQYQNVSGFDLKVNVAITFNGNASGASLIFSNGYAAWPIFQWGPQVTTTSLNAGPNATNAYGFSYSQVMAVTSNPQSADSFPATSVNAIVVAKQFIVPANSYFTLAGTNVTAGYTTIEGIS